MTTVFELLAASVPVDALAARAVAPGGAAYEPRAGWSPNQVHRDTPIETRPWPATSNPADNLTGMKRDRLTVVGLSAEAKSRWAVRCVCGGYEHRTSAAMKSKHQHARFMCSRCENTVKMREGYFE